VIKAITITNPIHDLPAFQPGTVLDMNRNLVVLIGDSGTGKSTLISEIYDLLREDAYTPAESLLAIESEERTTAHFARPSNLEEERIFLLDLVSQQVEQIYDKYGSKIGTSVSRVMERFDILKERFPNMKALKTFIRHGSQGQIRSLYIDTLLQQMQEKPEQDVLLLDEPEKGIGARQRGAFVQYLADHAKKGRQIILATHDLAFCKVPDTRIIDLNATPARSMSTADFDVDKYASSSPLPHNGYSAILREV